MISYCYAKAITGKSYPEKCMRELFDDVAGQSPLDPGESAKRSTRAPLRKRFYSAVGVAEVDGGLTITLDGKPIKTPSRKLVKVPNRAIASA